jgi:hypothetical protein
MDTTTDGKLPIVCHQQSKKAIESRIFKLKSMIEKKKASKKTISKAQESAIARMKKELFFLKIKKRLCDDTFRQKMKETPSFCLGLFFYDAKLIRYDEKLSPDEKRKVNKDVCSFLCSTYNVFLK